MKRNEDSGAKGFSFSSSRGVGFFIRMVLKGCAFLTTSASAGRAEGQAARETGSEKERKGVAAVYFGSPRFQRCVGSKRQSRHP